MIGLAIVVAGMVALGVLLVFVGVGQLIARRYTVVDRLQTLSDLVPVRGEAELPAGDGRRREVVAGALGRMLVRQSFAANMATDLARANLPLTVSEYLAVHALCFLVAFVVGYSLSHQVALALLAGLAGLLLPRIYVQRKQTQRMVAFQEQLPDVLSLVIGSLRSGYGLTVAMDTVAKLMPAPASEEFGRVVREVGLGVSITQALANLVRRVRSDDLDLIVTAIAIQYETGGNLAQILETVSRTIRERVRLKGQLRTLMSQANMQRRILTTMPFALGLIIYVLNPEYMSSLFTPGPTLFIPILTVLLVLSGSLVMGKLSQVDV